MGRGYSVPEEDEEDDMKAALESTNVTKIDQHHMNPTFLSSLINALPHVNFDMQTIESDIFDPGSSEYRNSLVIIGLMPVLAAALAVLGLYAFMKWKLRYSRDSVRKLCECFLQQLWYLCALLLALVLALEIILHIIVIYNLNPVILRVTHVMKDYQIKCIDKVLKATDNLRPYTMYKPYMQFSKYPYEYNFNQDIYQLYKKVVLEILAAVERVQADQLEPFAVHTPLKQYLIVYEWIRFIAFGLTWAIALYMICWYRSRRLRQRDSEVSAAKCSLCGLIFCSLSAMVLLMMTVSFADICQYPNYAVSGIRPLDMQKKFLRSRYDHFCKMFKHEMYMSMRNFVRTYRNAKRKFLRHAVAICEIATPEVNTLEANWNWPNYKHIGGGETHYKSRRSYSQHLYENFNLINTAKLDKDTIDWEENMECSQELKYIDQPEDPTPLCRRDKVLIIFLFQFFTMLAAAVLFFLILTTYVRRIKFPPPKKQEFT